LLAVAVVARMLPVVVVLGVIAVMFLGSPLVVGLVPNQFYI
jgi:hypothetical protein